jgi:hypothetical protein
MPVTSGLGSAVYRAALHLYPPAFRREFGSEMARDVEDASRDARKEGERRWRVAFWTAIAADLLHSAAVQWLKSGIPTVAMVAAMVVAATITMLARVWPAPPAVVALSAADHDLALLMLLSAVVLLLIVATIVFSLWFLRPLRDRPRR